MARMGRRPPKKLKSWSLERVMFWARPWTLLSPMTARRGGRWWTSLPRPTSCSRCPWGRPSGRDSYRTYRSWTMARRNPSGKLRKTSRLRWWRKWKGGHRGLFRVPIIRSDLEDKLETDKRFTNLLYRPSTARWLTRTQATWPWSPGLRTSTCCRPPTSSTSSMCSTSHGAPLRFYIIIKLSCHCFFLF